MNLARVSELTKSVTAEGIYALDLIGERARGEDFAKVKSMIELSYGIKYQEAPDKMTKVDVLFDLIAEEGWSAERLKATAKWVLKNKKFATWTPADWFEQGVKLFPYSWYLKQIAAGVRDEDMECYDVNGKILWKLNDGQELPFPRPEQKPLPPAAEDPEEGNASAEETDLTADDLVKVFRIDSGMPVNEQSSPARQPKYAKGSEAYLKAQESFLAALKEQLNG